MDRREDQPGPTRPGPDHAFKTLRLERQGPICWLVLDRSGKGNALIREHGIGGALELFEQGLPGGH